jgi:hypothetical protein
MKVICAWHPGYFGEELVMEDGNEPTSHGICPACLKRLEGGEKNIYNSLQRDVTFGTLDPSSKKETRMKYRMETPIDAQTPDECISDAGRIVNKPIIHDTQDKDNPCRCYGVPSSELDKDILDKATRFYLEYLDRVCDGEELVIMEGGQRKSSVSTVLAIHYALRKYIVETQCQCLLSMTGINGNAPAEPMKTYNQVYKPPEMEDGKGCAEGIVSCPYCGDYAELEEGTPLQVGGGWKANLDVECPHCNKTFVVGYFIDWHEMKKE